ncbi:MAG: carboxypeptidase-like regulatory domain-containing protein [Planctomycetota bacterium]|nr:carboxypeptidase-like regulatory domain-containing protein [Planctomycetota bacterium]MDA1113876.1 carboxypeptidase-like regulatory domain-containing protein [Planctomycetota bacterium]
MKLFARWGLVALIFAVALVFFGSVICPPIGERDAETEDAEVQYPLQEDAGTYKALPGELQMEDRFPSANTQRSDLPDSFSTIEVRVVDDRGNPVGGAMVYFLSKLEKGYAVRANGTTNDLGNFISPNLFDGKYEIRVNHDQYFIAFTDPIELPGASPTKIEVQLSPASFVSGLIHTASGLEVAHGEIRLTDLNSGESYPVEFLKMGTFRSPPLDPGYWSLSWSETVGGAPTASMRFALPLEHKQEREVHIVIPSNNPDAELVYEVGIRDYLD